jgi:hypothetical protein
MFLFFHPRIAGSIVGFCLLVSGLAQLSAQDLNESRSTSQFDSELPAPLTSNPDSNTTDADAAVKSEASLSEPPSEQVAPLEPQTPRPFQLVPLAPAAPKSPGPPKKPAPPAFPGPQVLPPVGPWKLMYFDNDFATYKKDPKHQYLPGEELKDMPMEVFGVPMLLSTGGEIRDRYMNEANRLRPGGLLVGKSTDYNLVRWRQYFDLRVGDFRVYFEGVDASSTGSSLPYQAIDVNRWDIQNLFGDWKFYNDGSNSQTARYGRQELSYGKQRLVSPLDWANTRRNFQGGRYIAKGDTYQFDLFCTHPVNAATGYAPLTFNLSHPDQPNNQVFFSGAYLNYTGIENTSIDAYWLFLDTTTIVNPLLPIGSRHTIGSRYGALYPVDGGSRVWDFDTEGAIQFGNDQSQQVLAGFYTAVGGHTWKEATYTPRVSSTFYYGSGSNSKGAKNGTFNTLFPLSHAYWALSDNVNGENLLNYAVQAEAKPTAKTSIVTAYHWFKLANANDNLYTVSGSPLAAAGHGPGRNVGTALDIYGYYAFNKAFDIQTGYSWFFFGDYFDTNGKSRPDCTQLYIQTTYRY